MGCCWSCLEGLTKEAVGGGGGATQSETEMKSRGPSDNNKTLAISRSMSAPTIEVEDRTKVKIRERESSVVSCLETNEREEMLTCVVVFIYFIAQYFLFFVVLPNSSSFIYFLNIYNLFMSPGIRVRDGISRCCD